MISAIISYHFPQNTMNYKEMMFSKKCIKAPYMHIVYIHIGFWRIKSFLDAFLKHSLTSIVRDGVVLQ